ncbi:MAG: DUF2846 domain-containing protein [Gammaproteobacteria bacterium]|nr:DUF2846 domain-containing protein [Gammaproteobacteria bacterium]
MKKVIENNRQITLALTLNLVMAIVLVASAKTLSKVEWHDTPEFGQPAAGKALVYFLREKKTVGRGIEARMYHGKDKIGALPNGTYFFYQVNPGEHTFTSALEVQDSVTLSLEAGETYYISAEPKLSPLGMPAKMEAIPATEGEAISKDLAYVTLRNIFNL